MIVWSLAAAAAPCRIEGRPGDPFRIRPSAERVLAVLEVWPQGAAPGWTDAVLDTIEAHGLPAEVVVPVGAAEDPDLDEVLQRVAEGPHDLALVLDARDVPRDNRSQRSVRAALRPIQRASEPVRTVVAPLGAKSPEALLGQLGLRSLVDLGSVSTSTPRMAGHFDGMPPVDVVVAPGPYEDACGEPRATPFLPATADRAALALELANRTPGQPTLRIAVVGAGGAPTDAEVLGRWLDEVLLPSKVRVMTAEAVRAEVLAAFRKPAADAPTGVDGRLVDVEQLRQQAATLLDGDTLPRVFGEDLSLTEMFAGLVLLQAGRTEGAVVRLRGLEGPAVSSTSTLTGPTEVDLEALTALCRALLEQWPHEVPSAIPLDGHLLTASELLVALASATTGRVPALTRPVAPPDPNARGLGWGRSSTP